MFKINRDVKNRKLEEAENTVSVALPPNAPWLPVWAAPAFFSEKSVPIRRIVMPAVDEILHAKWMCFV